MLALQMPVWAHVILLVACFALLAYLERAGWKRESGLRRSLGTARTRADAAEVQRDAYRRESESRLVRLQAQSVELARYRGQIPMELRVTQVLLSDKGEPEPEG
jgi:hypothetical protein